MTTGSMLIPSALVFFTVDRRFPYTHSTTELCVKFGEHKVSSMRVSLILPHSCVGWRDLHEGGTRRHLNNNKYKTKLTLKEFVRHIAFCSLSRGIHRLLHMSSNSCNCKHSI